jgi:3-demethoxyubiquinol 3-hydroxylase
MPRDDLRSRTIVEAMCDDEIGHGRRAMSAGAVSLPGPIRELMRRTARVMTHTSYRF